MPSGSSGNVKARREERGDRTGKLDREGSEKEQEVAGKDSGSGNAAMKKTEGSEKEQEMAGQDSGSGNAAMKKTQGSDKESKRYECVVSVQRMEGDLADDTSGEVQGCEVKGDGRATTGLKRDSSDATFCSPEAEINSDTPDPFKHPGKSLSCLALQ